MKVTILGCGGAGGVPLIGNVWGACDPLEPRNRRCRVSLLVEEDAGEGEAALLFDTSPDMREQLLRAKTRNLSAVFYTHAHADHAHGIDNIRSVNWLTGKPLPLYADLETLTGLRAVFPYVFEPPAPGKLFYKPTVETHEIAGDEVFTFGSLRVRSFTQAHGKNHSRGYRVNDFGYSTDASALDEAAFEALRGVKVWVLGASRERPHPTHAHVELALSWIERLRPERAYLTHMDHTLDYATLKAKLPAGIEPAYDGLEIVC